MPRNKNKKYIPEFHETKPGELKNFYVPQYVSKMISEAFFDLKDRQKVLFWYMVIEWKCETKKNIPTQNLGKNQFYFNWAIASKVYPLYTNKKTFYDDVEELIKHGFIKKVVNGKANMGKNLYEMSHEWQTWTDDWNVKANVERKKKSSETE